MTTLTAPIHYHEGALQGSRHVYFCYGDTVASGVYIIADDADQARGWAEKKLHFSDPIVRYVKTIMEGGAGLSQDQTILNLSDKGTKRMLKRFIDAAEGLHSWDVCRLKDQRTLKQNAFFHGVWLPIIARRMTELWGESVHVDRAKNFLKDRYLRVPIVNKETGEIIGHETRGTSDLDVGEFVEFLNQVQEFAREFLDEPLESPEQMQEVG